MKNSNPVLVDFFPTYSIISAKNPSTDCQVFFSLYSSKPLWVLCLKKSFSPMLKSFKRLNKSSDYQSLFLFFSHPSSISSKCKLSQQTFYIEKKFKDSFCKSFNISQFPTILIFNHGSIIFSSSKFPKNFLNLTTIIEPEIAKDCDNEAVRKIARLKEHVHLLKITCKKSQKKEVDYKTEITELKKINNNNLNEILKLKQRIEVLEQNQLSGHVSKSEKNSQLRHLVHKKSYSNSIWNNEEDPKDEYRDLNDICGSNELWINNLDKTNAKSPVKLYQVPQVETSNRVSEKEESKQKGKIEKILKSIRKSRK